MMSTVRNHLNPLFAEILRIEEHIEMCLDVNEEEYYYFGGDGNFYSDAHIAKAQADLARAKRAWAKSEETLVYSDLITWEEV